MKHQKHPHEDLHDHIPVEDEIKEEFEHMGNDDEEFIPLEHPRWRKWLIKISSIIGLILILIYFIPGESYQVVEGLIVSDNLKNNTLTKGDLKIVFDEKTLEELQTHFLENQDREIKACLYGEKNNNTIILNKVEFPNVFFANVFRVVSLGCEVRALANLHSHPTNKCVASIQDLNNHRSRKNPDQVMIVMCNINRFVAYSNNID